jgi:thiamine-phosphate pyrophosphorylase
MTICLVTDRRQRSPVDQAREAANAGVDLIQVRERDLEARELFALAVAVVQATRGSATKVVVNDRVDVAVTCGAHGVHLRGDSVPAARVRAIAPPGFLIGTSVRSGGEAVSAAGSDYLLAGTVFPTPSKPEMTAFLGLDGLAAVVRSTTLPVLAVGGITVEHAAGVAAVGARGVAAIGLFTNANRPIKEVVRQLRERFNIGDEKFL